MRDIDMLRVVISIVFALLACPIHAGEINFLGGYGATNNPVCRAPEHGKSDTWRDLASISPIVFRM
jgi:hypothetical protein